MTREERLLEAWTRLNECPWFDKCGGAGGATLYRESLASVCYLFSQGYSPWEISGRALACHASRLTIARKLERVHAWWLAHKGGVFHREALGPDKDGSRAASGFSPAAGRREAPPSGSIGGRG